MKKRIVLLLLAAALVAVLPATTGLAKGKPASTGVMMSVTGGGSATLNNAAPAPFSSAPFKVNDRFHLSLTARTPSHGRACSVQHPCGQFLVTDRSKKGSLVLKLKGAVTCASFSGKLANLSGVIKTGYSTPRSTTVKGLALAISVNDNAGTNGADLVGLGASFLSGTTASSTSCAGVTANLPITQGNFVVHT